ncbi:MAG: SpoVA/SpoVAEb family sporulation membrane protein [Bacilli bacterium]
MIYLNAFLVVGTICLIGQIIMDHTKLTNGHITSIFVVMGVVLGFLGLYDNISEFSKVGASIPITSFGNLLYKACIEGFEQNGFLGMLTNLLTTTSAGICSAIIFAITVTIFFKPKD